LHAKATRLKPRTLTTRTENTVVEAKKVGKFVAPKKKNVEGGKKGQVKEGGTGSRANFFREMREAKSKKKKVPNQEWGTENPQSYSRNRGEKKKKKGAGAAAAKSTLGSLP